MNWTFQQGIELAPCLIGEMVTCVPLPAVRSYFARRDQVWTAAFRPAAKNDAARGSNPHDRWILHTWMVQRQGRQGGTDMRIHTAVTPVRYVPLSIALDSDRYGVWMPKWRFGRAIPRMPNGGNITPKASQGYDPKNYSISR